MDFDATYTADNYGRIAWRVTSYVKVRDEDYEWSGIEEDDTTRVVAHMVGDDRDFEFGIDELTIIPEDAYCHECGQIGCGATNV